MIGQNYMFVQKDEKTIRQEVVEDLKGNDESWNEEEHQERIDRITQRRLKDEEMKATLHKAKTKRREMLEANGIDLETGKKKEEPKDPKKGQPGKEQDKVSEVDKMRFFGTGGSRKELTFIEKVMKAEDCDFNTAWKSGLFKSMKAENDKKIDKIKAQRAPNRGGSHKQKQTEEDKLAEEYSQNLPPGFSAKPKAK